MNKAIFILLALAAVHASATTVNTCGSGAVDTSSVAIVGCAQPPCLLKRGGIVKYSAKFTPSWRMGDLTVHIKSSRRGISLTFLDGTPACGKFLKTSDNSPAPCPLIPGVDYIYRDTFPVPTFLPTDRGTVTAFLKSGSTTVKCVEFPVIVQ